MSNRQVTTGEEPWVIGSDKLFVLLAKLDGRAWTIQGGTAILKLADPTGAITTLSGTITGATATAAWRVAAPVGDWSFAWDVTDAAGIRQVSLPGTFSVITSS